MHVITSVELRRNMSEILSRVEQGEDIYVKYRGSLKVKLIPVSRTKRKQTAADALRKVFFTQKHTSLVKKYFSKDTDKIVQTPDSREEKRKLKQMRYEGL